MKDKNYMVISIDAEKAFDNTQHPFMINTLNKISIVKNFLNTIKAILDNCTANIIVNDECFSSDI